MWKPAEKCKIFVKTSWVLDMKSRKIAGNLHTHILHFPEGYLIFRLYALHKGFKELFEWNIRRGTFPSNGRDKSAPGQGQMHFVDVKIWIVLYVNRVVAIYIGNYESGRYNR